MERFLLFFALFAYVVAFNPYPKSNDVSFKDDAGPIAMLSKYIKEGKIEEARSLSLVTGLTPNITSYAGFFTVDEDCDSNLFFWFFPSQNDPSKDPVSIWLQGGPGSTSLYGLLTELGPYNLKLDGTLELREYSWNRNSSIIFVDNPVGTGYSYTGRLSCYATEQTQVGRDVLNALEQFFQVFPEYKQNDFFVTGESYGGHYVPAVSYAIHTSTSSINLKGLAIGNGWLDPENQLIYSNLVYQLGLVDDATRQKIADHEEQVRQFIKAGDYYNATKQLNNKVLDVLSYSSGFGAFYNFLYPDRESEADYNAFVIQKQVRKALHTGNATWHGSLHPVYDQLYADITRSVRPWLEELLEHYRVLIYNGQLDIMVAYALTEGYLPKLNWSRAEEYRNAQRQIWYYGNSIAGYTKSAGNFTEVLVRNAGHMVPTDQPAWALDLYNKFIFGKPIAGR